MPYWIHKLTKHRRQLRVTIPSGLADIVGARKWEVVTMYPKDGCSGIIIEEWKGAGKRKRIWGDRAKKD